MIVAPDVEFDLWILSIKVLSDRSIEMLVVMDGEVFCRVHFPCAV